MSRVIVVGGGMIGLAASLLIAKQGHEVTVLERDPQPPPASPQEAWDSWDRPGVMQFRMAHILLAGGWQVVNEHLPEMAAALVRAGGSPYSSLASMPPTITDRAPRTGDELLTTITARRPVLEYAMAAAAGGAVDIRRGVQVTGLLSDGHRRVTGVRLGGEDLAADLVIDATGRRSQLPGWLAAIGAGAPAEQSEDLGFIYYGRFFRPPAGQPRPPLGAIGIVHYDSYSLLTLPSEADTWSVTVVLSAHDHALRPLREEANFSRLVSACPMHAPALAGEPVTGMMAAAGVTDRRRDLVTDTGPSATGVLAVGDAWSCTNPSLGRGITFGLRHAVVTAEAVSEYLSDPAALALAHDRLTRERVLPWYQATARADRQRAAQVAAVIEGRPPRAPSDDPAAVVMRNFLAAMPLDPDVFRAYLELMHALATPQEIVSRPGFAKRVSEVADGRLPAPAPGLDRAELLRMLS